VSVLFVASCSKIPATLAHAECKADVLMSARAQPGDHQDRQQQRGVPTRNLAQASQPHRESHLEPQAHHLRRELESQSACPTWNARLMKEGKSRPHFWAPASKVWKCGGCSSRATTLISIFLKPARSSQPCKSLS